MDRSSGAGLTQWPPGPHLRLLSQKYADLRKVDLVLVIDATASMGGLIGRVKASALDVQRQLAEALHREGQTLGSLRVRVITFRDLYHDRVPFQSSRFLRLPSEERTFRAKINAITTSANPTDSESGLEALGLAIQSAWECAEQGRRGVIVLWTDASAHPLERRLAQSASTLAGVPRSFNALTKLWHDMAESMGADLRRLVLFAPPVKPWTTITATWPQIVHRPSRAGGGLNEIAFGGIVDTIAKGLRPLE